MEGFEKRRPTAPEGFFAVEAAGLAWLAEAAERGGVPTPTPLDVAPDRIVLPHLPRVPATEEAATDFGRHLTATHQAGAPHHGAPPPGWPHHGYIGDAPLPHDLTEDRAVRGGEDLPWGRFYARLRLAPYIRTARDRGALSASATAALERVCARLEDGDQELTGPPEPVSRLHGDLWNGNVLWTPGGAVLIDPAAHGGHRETDLAMLALFGAPHLDRIRAAYSEAADPPLAPGREHRRGLHQLHPLLVHAVLFGGGYGAQAGDVARRL